MNPRFFVSAAFLVLALAPMSARAQCKSFEVTSIPSGSNWEDGALEDVDELAAGDAWAVGSYSIPSSPYTLVTFSLAVHWDGSSWTRFATPSPAPFYNGTNVVLHAVGAAASDDVWAGGERFGQAGGQLGQGACLQHWDGSRWSVVSLPVPAGGAAYQFAGSRIEDIVVLAPDDVWFGGAWTEQSGDRPLAMHWDGSALQVVPTPTIPVPGLNAGYAIRSFSALAPNDIWAACVPNTYTQSTQKNVVLHYDGTSWTQVAVPSARVSHELYEVVALAAGDVWLFGQTSFPQAPYTLHFDGSTWSEVEAAPLLSTATAGPSGSIYAGFDRITKFDGSTTEVVATFEGFTSLELLSLHGSSSCSMWAVGRSRVGGYLTPFAAHGGASAWQTVPGGIATSLGTVPSLTGAGSPNPGQPITLTLQDALPLTSQVLVVGLAELGQPLAGGVLVPTPDLVLGGLTSNAQGALQINATWPRGHAPGTELDFQIWMLDPAAPGGVAASNGLKATQP